MAASLPDKQGPFAYVPRILDAELDELMESLPAIAIEGAKAVGKTETASSRATTIYPLDQDDLRATVTADTRAALSAAPPILIDEWQLAPGTWDAVRRAVDAGAGPSTFLLTGSASPRKGSKHSGAGRIVSLRMRPLSLAERTPSHTAISLADLLTGERPAIGGDAQGFALSDYVDEIVTSGFPGLRNLSPRGLRAQLDGYLAHVVDRDIPELGQEVRNPSALRRWMRAYAAATATSASFEKIRAAATGGGGDKPARSTVQPYRDALERLFIADPLPAWLPTSNEIRELASPPKHHLADPALAVQLLGMTEDSLLRGGSPSVPVPRSGPFLGSLFESLVTLSVRVYAQAVEARVGHLRTHRGNHEVDLIVERGDGRVVAIEVKLTDAPDDRDVRHLRWLKEKLGDDLLDAALVTSGQYAYRRPDGIAVVPAVMLGP